MWERGVFRWEETTGLRGSREKIHCKPAVPPVWCAVSPDSQAENEGWRSTICQRRCRDLGGLQQLATGWVVCSRIQKWLCCTVSSAWWFSAGNQWMTQSKDKRQPSVRQQKTTPFFFLHDSWDEHLQDTDPNVSFKGCGLRPPPCQSPTC